MAAPTHDEIIGRIADALGVSESRVRPEVLLVDLVSDSYRLVEMAIDLQDDYDVIPVSYTHLTLPTTPYV